MYTLRVIDSEPPRWLRVSANEERRVYTPTHNRASHFFTLGGAGAVAARAPARLQIDACDCTVRDVHYQLP